MVRLGGRGQLLGIPAGPLEVSLATEVIFKGITICGVMGRGMCETWRQMTRCRLSGEFDPTPVITHRVPLEEFEEAMRVIKTGEAGKVVFEIA
jgi:threonine 3-dehydrogenase